MLEPVILDNSITAIAKHWRDEAIRRWNEPGEMTTIDDATITSPVDRAERTVRMHLALWPAKQGQRPVNAKTIPPNSGDQLPKDCYYNVFLNRLHAPGNPRLLLATLLHELAHTVDPHFDADCLARQQAEPDGEYDLPSEQRAFTAMWIEELRERMKEYPTRSGASFISGIRANSDEFKAFHQHAMSGFSDALENQIKYHFNKMAEYIKTDLSESQPSANT
jgi:hypothetical protein